MSLSHPDFAPFRERMEREGLPAIAINNFNYYYDTLAAGTTGTIGESAIEPVDSVPSQSEVAAYAEAGRAALERAVVLKLNGGLGTSMGLDRAKSLLVTRDGLTFLDIIARQNLHFRERYGAHVPLVLMNSFNTDADSQAVLANYPGLQAGLPLSIMQNKVPKIRQDNLAPAEWPDNSSLEWCPPGHGEVYIALAISGMLQALLDRGYEYLFISNVDNLGATLDLGILGYVAEQSIPFLMEVATRTEADKKGGHIARHRNGRLILREVAQCPEEDMAAFQDIHKYRYFNTNNIWVNLRQLKQVLDDSNNVLKLPMIRNAKTLDPKEPQSPAVFQLETAMGAAIEVFPDASVLHVSRERFMPVKTCNDLLGLRSDLFTLDEDYRLCVSPQRALGPITIDLDGRFYKLIDDFEERFPSGPPSLIQCAELSVQGDVLFEEGVVLRGNAQIVNSAGEQRRLPAGTLVSEGRYEL